MPFSFEIFWNQMKLPWTQTPQPNAWSDLKPINLSKIRTYPFPADDYFQEEIPKKQVVLHHTISGDGVDGDIKSWEDDKQVVGTAFIIDRLGTPWQLFSSKYWAWHLGVGKKALDSASIGIELDLWGWLIPGDGTTKQFGKNADGTPKMVNTIKGKYYAYYGNSVAVPMQFYPNGFRGYNYYEKYTDAQIRTTGELLLFFKQKYGIPLDYNEDMFEVSQRALNGTPGVWSHTSFRPAPDKTDIHPQPEMIEMLKTLNGIK